MGANLSRWLSQNRAFATALILFTILYLVYHVAYEIRFDRGFSSAVLIQNSNEMVAIGFVAMAQAVVVLSGGLDLSVGAIMTLCSCIASTMLT
ncbi:MAG: ABC transporter permease, partial [Deltaproteobacteria bacterium]